MLARTLRWIALDVAGHVLLGASVIGMPKPALWPEVVTLFPPGGVIFHARRRYPLRRT